MPNWCDNDLQIVGKPSEILRFFSVLKGEKAKYEHEPVSVKKEENKKEEPNTYTFNAIVPVPKRILEIGFDGNYRTWKFKELLDEFKVPYKPETEFRYISLNLSVDKKELGTTIIKKNLKVPGFDDTYIELTLKMKNYIKDKKKLKEAKKILKSILMEDDGYHWQVKNWGTKWDPEIFIEDDFLEELKTENADEDYEAIIYISSAWSPINMFIKKASVKFPKLIFTNMYSEPGCCFQGEFKVQDGEVLVDICEDYMEEDDKQEEVL